MNNSINKESCFTVLLLVLCFCIVSCCRDSDDIKIDQLTQSGHFSIINNNNGETLTIIGDKSNSAKLNAREGDVLKMQYVPDEQYKDLNYQVSFTIHDNGIYKATVPDYTVEYALTNIAVRNYTISMTAVVNEKDTQSISIAACTLVVKE